MFQIGLIALIIFIDSFIRQFFKKCYYQSPGAHLNRSLRSLRSLSNHDGDAEDNVDYKAKLYFIQESLDSRLSRSI